MRGGQALRSGAASSCAWSRAWSAWKARTACTLTPHPCPGSPSRSGTPSTASRQRRAPLWILRSPIPGGEWQAPLLRPSPRPTASAGRRLRRCHGRPLLPAGRPHSGGRRLGAGGHPLQLLRHGPHRGRPVLDLRQRAGGRPHHAAGRRHRPRLLHAASQGRAGKEHRRRRLRAGELHGRVGRHVPHHHVGRCAARRHDGHAPLRPPRHRGLHRRQGRSGAPAQLQPVGAGDRRLHRRGAPRCALGSDLRGQGLPHRRRPRPVGPHHARHLRLCRARRGVHRPHQRAEQPRLLRDDQRYQSLRRAAPARPTAPASWARSISPA